MSIPADHVPLTQESFNGLYTRGVSDTAPDSFFSDCLNNKYSEGEVSSRDGLVLNFSKDSIVRYATYKRLGETPRLIVLDAFGNLFDSLFPNAALLTDADIVDFSLVNINNRAYITPHNRSTGIAGKSVYVYEGNGTIRLAAGTAPSGFTLVAAESASSGHCEAGIKFIAVAYITPSGFITAPGPVILPSVVSTGGFGIDVSSIPIGPAGTAARVLLSTKSIPVSLFVNNQLAYELFFIPNAVINDNTTTTATVSFFDADLSNSADYLLDNLSTIPAGVGIGAYSGRMMVWAENENPHTIRYSNVNDPETFNAISGFQTLDPSQAISGVRNAAEFRKSLILFKSDRMYTTTDNGSDPNSWGIDVVDKSSGTECFGINQVLDATGSNTNRMLYADRSGIIAFEGFVKRPELTFNIEDTWKRINKAKFNLVHLIDDPLNHRIIAAVPLDASTTISHLLVGDYSKANTIYGTLNETLIKWTIWTFPSNPVCILGDKDAVTFDATIHIALAAGNIYDMKVGLTDDFGTAIDSWFKTSLKSSHFGWVNHFGGIKLRVNGSGNLQITLYGEDLNNPVTVPVLALASSPGAELDRLINYTNEKISIKFRVSFFSEKYTVSRLDLYAKPLWLRRPG